MVATDVPPNFMTTVAILETLSSACASPLGPWHGPDER
jgi:hypothetical protein